MKYMFYSTNDIKQRTAVSDTDKFRFRDIFKFLILFFFTCNLIITA